MYEIQYLNIEENKNYEKVISRVIKKCFEIENLPEDKICVSIILTNQNNIQNYNKKYRNIDKPTDVLSFPMFEKFEIDDMLKKQDWKYMDILGDMIISIEQVKTQSKEYGHSFERELSYMVVHSFYHLMGYDHIEEKDKLVMREKEEYVLNRLKITR